MKIKYIVLMILLASFSSLAQEEPKIEEPKVETNPSKTYTNGISIKLFISDKVYRQLKTAYKLSNATNEFRHWITNNVKIELSEEAATTKIKETQELSRKVLQLGDEEDDDSTLIRVKKALTK